MKAIYSDHESSRAGRVLRAVLRQLLREFKFSTFDSQGEIKAALASTVYNFKRNESPVSARAYASSIVGRTAKKLENTYAVKIIEKLRQPEKSIYKNIGKTHIENIRKTY